LSLAQKAAVFAKYFVMAIAPLRKPHVGDIAKGYQGTGVMAIAALELVTFLYCLSTDSPAPPRSGTAHLIHCACELDPAMQRLEFPRSLPFVAPVPRPPKFAPSR